MQDLYHIRVGTLVDFYMWIYLELENFYLAVSFSLSTLNIYTLVIGIDYFIENSHTYNI